MKQYLMVALGLAALTGCSENAAAGNGKGGRPDALVRVAKVTSGPLPVTWTYMGEVRSMARAQLSVSEAGVVVDVRVREGDRVTRGDLLLRVDPNLARAQLVTAEAARRQTETEREQAERDAKRFDAAGRLAVPAAEIERARAEVASLEAQGKALEAQALEARVTMERHRITAPFAGLIARRFVDPGDWITAGARALELVADDSMEILAEVDPDVIAHVQEGMPVTLRRGTHSLKARIVGIVRAVDPNTRTSTLRALPETTPPWLLPGTAVHMDVTVEPEKPGLLVPRDALLVGPDETRVAKIESGKAKIVTVEVLATAETMARIRTKALSEGDTVAVRGNDRLRDGQPVGIAKP